MCEGQLYEVRVEGPLSIGLIETLGGPAVEEPAQTVLFTSAIDQAELLGLISRLSAFGLELVEVRRITCGDRQRIDPGQAPDAGDRTRLPCYEVSVRGLLGPLLLTALGDFLSASAQRSTLWTIRCWAPGGLSELVASLAAHRVAVVNLHLIERAAEGARADTINTGSGRAG